MNGYLILVRRSFDSEPIGLYATEAAAIAEAAGFLTMCETGCDPKGAPTTVLRGIRSTFVGLEIVPFVDSKPSGDRKWMVPGE